MHSPSKNESPSPQAQYELLKSAVLNAPVALLKSPPKQTELGVISNLASNTLGFSVQVVLGKL